MNQNSIKPPFNPLEPERIRLNKWLASFGLGSRRAVEALIRGGRVKVNGQETTDLATMIIPGKDHVRVDGNMLPPHPPAPIYLALHKPKGLMTTRDDPEGRPTVMALLPPGMQEKVFPVGRLDFNSEGLLLFTNDGDLAQRLIHPSFRLPKVYLVKFKGELTDDDVARLIKGVKVEGRLMRAESIQRLPGRGSHTWLRMVLTKGLYRQIRLMGMAIGHLVMKLKRTAIGPISLGQLPIGRVRDLTPQEITALKALAYGERSNQPIYKLIPSAESEMDLLGIKPQNTRARRRPIHTGERPARGSSSRKTEVRTSRGEARSTERKPRGPRKGHSPRR